MTKKIALIGDFKVDQVLGGAAFVDSYLAGQLQGYGFDVDYLAINTGSSDWAKLVAGAYDGVIYSNLAGMTIDQLEWICQSSTPYILFRHDIPSVVYRFEDAADRIRAVFVELFKVAKCSIFISELQRCFYARVLALGPSTVLPPPISFGDFREIQQSPRSGLLYLGPICESRGLRRSLEWYKQSGMTARLDVFGRIEDAALARYVTSEGVRIFPEIGRNEVPSLFSRYEALVYHPNIIDSFCIKVLEAELCGMTLHVDREKIGRFSYPEDSCVLSRYMESGSAVRIGKIAEAFFWPE